MELISRRCCALAHAGHRLARVNRSLTWKRYSSSKSVDSSSQEGETTKKRQFIEMEMKIRRLEGNGLIPSTLTEQQWNEVLKLKTVNQRMKYYRYCTITELNKQKQKVNHALKVEERRKRNASDPELQNYGIQKNCMFFRIGNRSLNRMYLGNRVHGMLFGQNVVVDFGYEEHLNDQEIKMTAQQLSRVHSEMKSDREPFHLHFCNVNANGRLMDAVRSAILPINAGTSCITITEKSYTDIFPKQQLVYLTSDSKTELKNYSPHHVYVVGGLMDIRGQGSLSLTKAKQEKIQTAKFPLDKYILDWRPGTRKSLSLFQVFQILTIMKDTLNWVKAVECIRHCKSMSADEDWRKLERYNRSYV